MRFTMPLTAKQDTAIAICFQDTIDITVAAMYHDSIRWYHEDTLMVSRNDSLHYHIQNAVAADTGRYMVVAYAAANGCQNDTLRLHMDVTGVLTERSSIADNDIHVANDTLTICEGDTLKLTYVANNASSGYSWYKDSVCADSLKLHNVTADTTFRFVGDTSAVEGRWIVAALNNCGVIYDTVEVVVTRFARFTTQPDDTTSCEGDSIYLTSAAIYADSVIWYKVGAGKVDSGSVILLTDSLVVADTGRYYSIAYHTCKSDTSDTMQVGIIQKLLPEPINAERNDEACEGSKITMTWVVQHADSMAWYRDGNFRHGGKYDTTFVMPYVTPDSSGLVL